MKIYILRHEERYEDCSFFTPLTKKGLANANNLVKILDSCHIDLIFASPFIRTLQTIYPYAKKKNILVNIDYSLSEIHRKDIIPKKAVGLQISDELAKDLNFNINYKSQINSNEIIYPEEFCNVFNRMKKFLKYILITYVNTNYNIILVTHQSLCNSALKINKDINNENIIKNYPTGKCCLIFDYDKWSFKEIN
jgi:broad specificity phosphatase PhoE